MLFKFNLKKETTGQVPDKYRTSIGQVPDKYRTSTGQVEILTIFPGEERSVKEIMALIDIKHHEAFLKNYP